MKIVTALLHHPDFVAAVDTIERNEVSRRFCRHGLTHLLDVARITWILCLENQRSFDKEVVYLAALLHDLGRCRDNANHDAVSVTLAAQLLPACGASEECCRLVTEAISMHRQKNAAIDLSSASLGELLAYADKQSRACFRCAAAEDCYWDAQLKNNTVLY